LAALNLPLDQVPEDLRADTFFWQAESLLDLGKWPDAEQKYRALLALKDIGDRTDQANLGLAWALFNQGKEADAQPLIQALIQNKGGSPAGQQAQLLLAKIDLAQKQFKEAIAAFEALLATSPDKEVAFETNFWLGETYAANGQPDKAAAAFQSITGDPQAFPRWLVARAWLGLGRAQHALQQNDQAMLAYEQTYHLTENEGTQLDAFRAYLESARGREAPGIRQELRPFRARRALRHRHRFGRGPGGRQSHRRPGIAPGRLWHQHLGPRGQRATRPALRPHRQTRPGDQGLAKLHRHQH
jgi:tetratricopeptide (TPR) repeat protein